MLNIFWGKRERRVYLERVNWEEGNEEPVSELKVERPWEFVGFFVWLSRLFLVFWGLRAYDAGVTVDSSTSLRLPTRNVKPLTEFS